MARPAQAKMDMETALTQHASSSEMEDETLIVLVAQQDHAAFSRLTARHLKRAYGIALRILGDPAEAEDVTQETFAKIWIHAPRWIPGKAKFTTWLYRIAANLSIDRKRRRRPNTMDEIPEQQDEQTPDGFETIHSDEITTQVRRAIDQLPDNQRTAILLCGHNDLSNAEAAEAMGLSVKAVESLLVRARRSLREKLHTFYQEAR